MYMYDADIDSQLHALCPGAPSGIYESTFAKGNRVPFAVQPRRGRAVVFWQETIDGQQVLHDVFHNGCKVRGGLKIAFQKYPVFILRSSVAARIL